MQLANRGAFRAMTRIMESPPSIEESFTEELSRSLQERKELIKSRAPSSTKPKRSRHSSKKKKQKEKEKQKKLQQKILRKQEAEKTYKEFLK